MKEHITHYIKNCIVCRKQRTVPDTRNLAQRHIPQPIGQVIELDLLHMPEDEEGYNTICVIVMLPSTLVSLIPQKNRLATSTAESLFNHMSILGILCILADSFVCLVVQAYGVPETGLLQ